MSKPEPALLPRPTVPGADKAWYTVDEVIRWLQVFKPELVPHAEFITRQMQLAFEKGEQFAVHAAEVRELRELLAWADDFIERCKGGITSYTDYHLRMHAAVKKALAASEAGAKPTAKEVAEKLSDQFQRNNQFDT